MNITNDTCTWALSCITQWSSKLFKESLHPVTKDSFK